MKTFKETALEIIRNAKGAKSIYDNVNWISVGGSPNNIGYEICKMIVENSNDFTKDIAEKWIARYEGSELNDTDENGRQNMNIERPLSDKQNWCLSYQVMNNVNVYI